MRSYLAALLTLLLVIMTSCGGGGSKSSPTTPSGVQTNGIQGPDLIQEGQSAQYSIERVASASATYRWTVNPPAFGTFTNPHAASTEFTAKSVTTDTNIEINATVTPSGGSPTVSKLVVTIKNNPGNEPIPGENDPDPDPEENPTPDPDPDPVDDPDPDPVDDPDPDPPSNEQGSPVASAQADPTVVPPDGYVQFNCVSADPDGASDIVQWEWDFSYDPDDGFTPENFEMKPMIQFVEEGIHKVMLKVTDSGGNSDMLDEPFIITVTSDYLNPVAMAVINPSPTYTCETVQFQNSGSHAQSGNSIVDYEWDWDNDGIYDESGLFTEHTWDEPGVYPVQFRVTDDNGYSTELASPLAVIVLNEPPVAMAEVDDMFVRVGEVLAFQATGSNDPGVCGEIANYEWDWENDGEFDDINYNADHIYPYPGTFEVMLRVTDSDGLQSYLEQPFIITVEPGYTQTWGGTGDDHAYGVAIDSSGNLYVSGTFQNTVDFDPGYEVLEQTSGSGSSGFLMKFDPDFKFQWVSTWDTLGDNSGNDIVITTPNNIYVAGTPTLIKFDEFGTMLWEYNSGQNGQGVTYDDFKGMYVGGYYMAGGEQNNNDAFLSNLSFDGELLWEKTWGSSGCDQVYGIGLDPNGNIIATGHFEGFVDFDPDEGVDIHESVEGSDSYLTKFDPTGCFIWCVSWEATEAYGMDIDQYGNIFVTGFYEGETDFDPGPDEAIFIGNMGSYLAKYDENGSFNWAAGWTEWEAPPTPNYDPGYAVKCDQFGNVYVGGSFEGPVDFDPTGGQDVVTEGGAYVAQYKTDGTYQRVHAWGNHNDTTWDNALDITVDAFGHTFISGDFVESSDFGVDGSEIHVSEGEHDAFLLKLPTYFNW